MAEKSARTVWGYLYNGHLEVGDLIAFVDQDSVWGMCVRVADHPDDVVVGMVKDLNPDMSEARVSLYSWIDPHTNPAGQVCG